MICLSHLLWNRHQSWTMNRKNAVSCTTSRHGYLAWNNVEAFTLVLESYVSVQQSLLYTSWRRLEKLKKLMSWKFWGSLLHLISTNQAPWSPQIFMSRIFRSKNLKLDELTAYSNQRTCRRYILLSVYSQDVPQQSIIGLFMQILQPWVVEMLFINALLARSNQVIEHTNITPRKGGLNPRP